MVRNGNCLMPHAIARRYIFSQVSHHPYCSSVYADAAPRAFPPHHPYGEQARRSHDIFRHNIDFLGIFIKLHFALHAQIFTLFDFIAQFGIKNTFFTKNFTVVESLKSVISKETIYFSPRISLGSML